MKSKITIVNVAKELNENYNINDIESITVKNFEYFKRMRGKINNNEKGINSEVIFDDTSLDKMGVIQLKRPIMHPFFFNYINNLCKKKISSKLLLKAMDTDDYISIKDIYNEGVDSLISSLNNDLFLTQYKEHIFIDSLIVIPKVLRPICIMKELKMVMKDKINNKYNMIIRYNNNIGKIGNTDLMNDIEHNNLQMLCIELYDDILNRLKGKKGFIRNNIMGGRVNFSARGVILPMLNNDINSIILPYVMVLELYKYHIINILMVTNSITAIDAYMIVDNAKLEYNEKVSNIMSDLINKYKGGLNVLLNRNPTINYGSIIKLRIKDFNRDINDYTISISNNILEPLAGDYDGDALNIIPLLNVDNDDLNIFKPDNCIIDKNNGKVKAGMLIARDVIMNLRQFTK